MPGYGYGSNEEWNVPPMKVRVLRNFLRVEGLPVEIEKFLENDLSRLTRRFYAEGWTLPEDLQVPPQSQGPIKRDLLRKSLVRGILCEVPISVIEAVAKAAGVKMPPTDDKEALLKKGAVERRWLSMIVK